jgi:hypothetical protein
MLALWENYGRNRVLTDGEVFSSIRLTLDEQLTVGKLESLGMRRNEALRTIEKARRMPERRRDQRGRWEYRCKECQQWLAAKRFPKRGKGYDVYLDQYCQRCTEKTARRARLREEADYARRAGRRALSSQELSRLLTVEIENIYADAARLTREKGFAHHVDHVLPVNHPLVCGLHVPANLQVLTGKDNITKSNKFQPYYEDRDGRVTYIDEDASYVVNGTPKFDRPPQRIRVIKKRTNIK